MRWRTHLPRVDAAPDRRASPASRTVVALLRLVGLVGLLGVSGALPACGRDGAEPPAADDGRSPPTPGSPTPAVGPLATYRLATTRSADGDSMTLEALLPCQVVLEVAQDGAREGSRTRDLEPGEAVRIAWSLTPVTEAPRGSSPATGPTPGEITHRIRYSIDDVGTREALLRIGTTVPTPWVRRLTASPPVSPTPVPSEPIVLAAVGVADLTAHAGLALALEPTPAVVGAPEGTPPSSLHVAFLRLRVTPR